MRRRLADTRPATAGEWDRAYAACPHATFFHSRLWAEVWASCGAGRYRPAPQLVRFADGDEALLPLTRVRRAKGFLSWAVSSPAGTYGGWLARPGVGEAHGDELARVMVHAAGEVWWRLNPYDVAAKPPAGSTVEADETDAIELADGFPAVRARFSRGHRSAANKARRQGIEVVRARDAADWEAYYRVTQDSLRRWGGVGGVADYGARVFVTLRRLGSPAVTLWLARHEGRVLAGALCVSTGHHVCYWHGAALASAFALRPSTLLLEEAIRDACASGAAWFDMNPSGGLEGVREFKRRFGTRPLPCPVVIRRGLLARALTIVRERRRTSAQTGATGAAGDA